LVNVIDHSDTHGLGEMGKEQMDWLEKDLKGLSAETPVVVYAHVPLWTVYEKWGWGTKESEAVLGLIKRFGSVTVLNGHVHQVLQKVEGKVTFHAARSTAFPQPEPGKAEKPGPIKTVAADKLKSMLGLTTVEYVEKPGSLAVVDSTLE
jgi:3',5'-cyclic AMP phosphodiesterase CpdA